MPGFAEFVGIACFSFGLQSILLSVRDGMQQPSRAPSAVAYALVAVVGFYSVALHVYRELLHVYRKLLHVYRALLHVYRALLHVYRKLLHVYRKLLHVYRALLHVYRKLLHVYRKLLHVYRALLHVCRELLHVYRKLLHVYRALLHVCRECARRDSPFVKRSFSCVKMESEHASISRSLVLQVVGLVFSELFEKAPNGVEQMIIQNLPVDQPIATLVIACSAAVAALSMPLPMFPLVELLYMYALYLLPSTQSLSGGSSAALAAKRTVVLRLLILLATSSTACFFQGFASVAGFLGCLTIISSQLLPPLIHLRLCSWPAMSSAQHSKERSCLACWRLAVDIGFALLGGASFVYFTWLTGRQLALGTGS